MADQTAAVQLSMQQSELVQVDGRDGVETLVQVDGRDGDETLVQVDGRDGEETRPELVQNDGGDGDETGPVGRGESELMENEDERNGNEEVATLVLNVNTSDEEAGDSGTESPPLLTSPEASFSSGSIPSPLPSLEERTAKARDVHEKRMKSGRQNMKKNKQGNDIAMLHAFQTLENSPTNVRGQTAVPGSVKHQNRMNRARREKKKGDPFKKMMDSMDKQRRQGKVPKELAPVTGLPTRDGDDNPETIHYANQRAGRLKREQKKTMEKLIHERFVYPQPAPFQGLPESVVQRRQQAEVAHLTRFGYGPYVPRETRPWQGNLITRRTKDTRKASSLRHLIRMKRARIEVVTDLEDRLQQLEQAVQTQA